MQRLFVASDQVWPDLAIAVIAKASALVNGSQARPRRIGIKAQKTPIKAPRALGRPCEQDTRNLSAAEASSHSEAVDKCGLATGNVWPEDLVLQLELNRPSDLTSHLREVELSAKHIGGDALGRQFISTPEWGATGPEPFRSFEQDA